MPLRSIDPTTGETIATYEEMTDEEVSDRLERAREAFSSWRLKSVEERAAVVRRAADVLERRREEFARLMTREMGKPIVQSRAEVDKCA